MNITPFTIYIWQQADSIAGSLKCTSFFLCIASVVAVAFCGWHYFCANGGWADDKRTFPCLNENLDVDAANALSAMVFNTLMPWAKRLVFTTVICFFGGTLLPRSNTVAMMVVIPKIAESKAIQQDLPDIYNAAVDALKSKLVEQAKK
jgi:hypothetical protein